MNMSNYVYNLEGLKQRNIKYILSIGKRQPMHIEHKKSLEKILALKDMQLVYVIGSANLKGDPLFDPIINPLSIEEQKDQFRAVFPDASPVFLTIEDVPDMGQWGDIIIKTLKEKGIDAKECAIYFIGKDEDRLDRDLSENGVSLKKGQWLIEALSYWGFVIWFDQDLAVNLNISARNLRKMDLLNENNLKLLAAPEYIQNLAIKARENNPELVGEPITMYDLSLKRGKS
jgi:hypothetical protein